MWYRATEPTRGQFEGVCFADGPTARIAVHELLEAIRRES